MQAPALVRGTLVDWGSGLQDTGQLPNMPHHTLSPRHTLWQASQQLWWALPWPVVLSCRTPPLVSHRRVVMTACKSATNRTVLLAAIAHQLTLPEIPPDCRARLFASLPVSWRAGLRQAGRA